MTNYLAQVQRDREMTLRHDRFFVIRQRFFIGPPIREWAEDYTVIEARELNEAVDYLMNLDGPRAVIAVDVRAGTATDVSKAVALEVSSRIRAGEADLCGDLRDFIEEYFAPGSLLPAVA